MMKSMTNFVLEIFMFTKTITHLLSRRFRRRPNFLCGIPHEKIEVLFVVQEFLAGGV